MDKRKIIAFGTNSFVVSLPKNWIDKNKLKKGDVVNMTTSNTELTISSSEKEELVEDIEINVDKDLNILRTELVTAYLQGYDTIVLSGKTLNKSVAEVRKFMILLPGLEIMQLTSENMKLKNLLNERNISVSEIVSRTHFMIKSMLQECIDDFGKDIEQSIRDRDKEVNRMVFLSFRVITKALKNSTFAKDININPLEAMIKGKIMLRLEKIGDQIKRISRAMKSLPKKGSNIHEAKKILILLQTNYSAVIESYITKNKYKLLEIATYSKARSIDKIKILSEGLKDPMMFLIVENYKNMSSSIESIAQSALREM